MSSEKMIIAIVGSGFSLSMCAAYLAEKLQYLKPAIVAVQLPPQEHESSLSFAFPQFAEPMAPMLRKLLTESPLDRVTLSSATSPDEFAFNFSPYGVVSGAVTFPHAYEICRQHSAGLPSYDYFLGVQPPASPGVLYARQHLSTDFQHMAVRKGVIYVPSKSLDFNLAGDGRTILSVETSSGQLIEADYFIDCSADGVVMQHLQKKRLVPEKLVPRCSLVRRSHIDVHAQASVKFIFDRARVSCIVSLNGERHEKIYDFEDHTEHFTYFEQPWFGNCIALGRGFAAMPELLIDADRMLERQLATLSWLLGVNSDTTYASRHFNRLSIRHLDEALDVTNLLLNPMGADHADLTAGNQRRVTLFQSSASTVKEDNGLISESAWTGLLHFAGYIPKNTNAVSVATDSQRIIDLTKSLLSR